MVDAKTVRLFERKLLEAATNGPLLPGNDNLNALKEELAELWGDGEGITAVLDVLIDSGHLWPFRDTKTGAISNRTMCRGITPKGIDRLDQLRAPRKVWARDNWFALLIALSTIATSIGSLIVNILD